MVPPVWSQEACEFSRAPELSILEQIASGKIQRNIPGLCVLSTGTPWKFNIAPENIPSQKERLVFQPSFFSGYVKIQECTWRITPTW